MLMNRENYTSWESGFCDWLISAGVICGIDRKKNSSIINQFLRYGTFLVTLTTRIITIVCVWNFPRQHIHVFKYLVEEMRFVSLNKKGKIIITWNKLIHIKEWEFGWVAILWELGLLGEEMAFIFVWLCTIFTFSEQLMTPETLFSSLLPWNWTWWRWRATVETWFILDYF